MLEIQYFTKIVTLTFEAKNVWKKAFTFLCGMTSKFWVSKRREENELKVILRHRKNDVVCNSNLFLTVLKKATHGQKIEFHSIGSRVSLEWKFVTQPNLT